MKQVTINDVIPIVEQKGILAVCAANRIEKKHEIHKKWKISRFEVSFHWGDSNALWSRFGGGWNWKLGVQVSAALQTWVFSFLVFSITIYLPKKKG